VTGFLLTVAGDSYGGAGVSSKAVKKVIGLKLDVLGKTLSFHISIDKDRMKLADIVLPARTICDRIASVAVKKASSEGNHIQCRKGCSACCSRYLVPMSVPEALRFKEEIDMAPAYRRQYLWDSCLRAAHRILKRKPPEPLTYQTDAPAPAKSVDLNLVSSWYANLKIACPFLCNHECSIYSQRPLACREHFIMGSARACRGHRGVAEVLDMPVRLPNVLGQLASELEGTDVQAVILPLALVWCRENPQRAGRNWPAEMMVERFVGIVETMARSNAPAVVS
jgi:Fe-S-cluster containining protein